MEKPRRGAGVPQSHFVDGLGLALDYDADNIAAMIFTPDMSKRMMDRD